MKAKRKSRAKPRMYDGVVVKVIPTYEPQVKGRARPTGHDLGHGCYRSFRGLA